MKVNLIKQIQWVNGQIAETCMLAKGLKVLNLHLGYILSVFRIYDY